MITSRNLDAALAQRLSDALNKVNNLYTKQGVHMIFIPDEYYFVERTLVELGYLHPNKNGCAHTEFLNLMDDLQIPFRLCRPSLDQLRWAQNNITKDPFPWKPAGEGKLLEANTIDCPRWRAIYHWLHKFLQE